MFLCSEIASRLIQLPSQNKRSKRKASILKTPPKHRPPLTRLPVDGSKNPARPCPTVPAAPESAMQTSHTLDRGSCRPVGNAAPRTRLVDVLRSRSYPENLPTRATLLHNASLPVRQYGQVPWRSACSPLSAFRAPSAAMPCSSRS